MCEVFCQQFTTCSGVYKIKVIHTTYPQVVYNSDEKTDFTSKNCCFPFFLMQKHLFSVDNPVHSVYKQELNNNLQTIYLVLYLQWTKFFFSLFQEISLSAVFIISFS